MTSEIFKYVVISATSGAVFGVILKHCLDTRIIKEIMETYEDLIAKIRKADDKYADGLKDIIKRQDALIAAQQAAAKATQPKKVKFRECADFFSTLVNEPLPDGWQELDFPNNSKEEQ